jgi:copper transport protein
VHRSAALRRTALAVLAVGVLTVAVLLVHPGAASAHDELRETSPANGAHLTRPPATVTMRFSEQVTLIPGGIRMLASTGKAVRTGSPRVEPGRPDTVVLPLPARLADGVYTVSWRVVSADSHPVQGAFAFAVGEAPDVAATPPTSLAEGSATIPTHVAIVAGVATWLGYAGAVLFVGGAVFLLACWPGGWTHRRTRRLLRWGWVVSVVAAVLALLLHGPYVRGVPLSHLADAALLAETVRSPYGIAVLVRLALMAVAAVVLVVGGRRRGHLLALVGVAMLATWPFLGHARVGRQAPLGYLADLVHLTAVTTWLGGLVLLLTCLLPVVPEGGTAAVARFSRLALCCVLAIVATGVYQAWRQVGRWDAFVDSSYGLLVDAKVAGLVLVVGFAAVSRSVVWHHLSTETGGDRRRHTRRLRRSVATEASVAAVILGLTAALVTSDPEANPSRAAMPDMAAEPTPTGPATATMTTPSHGRVIVQVTPAQVGENRATVTVRDAAGSPVDVPEVTARLSSQDLGPLPIELHRQGKGVFTGTATIPARGTWRLEVRVRTTDVDEYATTAQIAVR